MEQELIRLRQGRGNSGAATDFLAQLEELAPHLSSGDYRLESLDYNGASINLEVSVPDYETLDRLQQRLSINSAVNLENAELREGRVYGRFLLGRKV
jgi:type II secretory pathway component PulL